MLAVVSIGHVTCSGLVRYTILLHFTSAIKAHLPNMFGFMEERFANHRYVRSIHIKAPRNHVLYVRGHTSVQLSTPENNGCQFSVYTFKLHVPMSMTRLSSTDLPDQFTDHSKACHSVDGNCGLWVVPLAEKSTLVCQ